MDLTSPEQPGSVKSQLDRERPILFSAPMVRALLDGRKTQTRRAIKPQPYIDERGNVCVPNKKGGHTMYGQRPDGEPQWDSFKQWRCPYGVPGDLLWVREAWAAQEAFDHLSPSDIGKVWAEEHGEPSCPIRYAADGKCNDWSPEQWQESPLGKTRVSIHMPRWASRITLRITDVRVERLQEISEGDAEAEGVQHPSLVPILGAFWSSRDGFARLWNSINGPGSWDANPWVWVVRFEVANPDAPPSAQLGAIESFRRREDHENTLSPHSGGGEG